MKVEKRGRKKILPDEKKINVTIYYKKEKIDSIGGLESAKEIIVKTLNNLYEKRK